MLITSLEDQEHLLFSDEQYLYTQQEPAMVPPAQDDFTDWLKRLDCAIKLLYIIAISFIVVAPLVFFLNLFLLQRSMDDEIDQEHLTNYEQFSRLYISFTPANIWTLIILTSMLIVVQLLLTCLVFKNFGRQLKKEILYLSAV